ncbi:MAG: hypothetical protein CL685_03750 [Candidatus Magasanikbacteria bacterium]|nr:hypothetical protein [Candidatus Magasanikbacteria bacterium]|tara:strand:+ start:1348 stop:2025 length:678 start_codon:yes stop_codon:yes gene_type:complete
MNYNEYTLQLFKILLQKKPFGIDEGVFAQAQNAYESVKKSNAPLEEIEKHMKALGAHAWPYWQAEREFKETHTREKEKSFFLDQLPDQLQKKYIAFQEGGGDIHNFRKGDDYEKAFTPEEDAILQETAVETASAMRDYVKNLATSDEKKEEYAQCIAKYTQELAGMKENLNELALLKEKNDAFAEEIDGQIDFFEKGFAEIEERPTKEKVQGKLEWYKGQIEGLS